MHYSMCACKNEEWCNVYMGVYMLLRLHMHINTVEVHCLGICYKYCVYRLCEGNPHHITTTY